MSLLASAPIMSHGTSAMPLPAPAGLVPVTFAPCDATSDIYGCRFLAVKGRIGRPADEPSSAPSAMPSGELDDALRRADWASQLSI